MAGYTGAAGVLGRMESKMYVSATGSSTITTSVYICGARAALYRGGETGTMHDEFLWFCAFLLLVFLLAWAAFASSDYTVYRVVSVEPSKA